MKRTILLFVALGLVLGACTNSFTPTALSSETSAAQTSLKATNNPITSTSSFGLDSSLTYGSKDQKLTIRVVANLSASVDQTAFVSALTVNKLAATANTDGSYKVTAAVILGTPDVTYIQGTTMFIYTPDLSSDTALSDYLEVYIDATKFTAAGGNKVLDLDGDGVLAETGDDDLYDTVAVSGAPVTAAGYLPNPQSTLSAGYSGGVANLSTAVTVDITTVGGADAVIENSLLQSAFALQKFNATTGAWDAVSVTGTYAAGTYTMTLGTAMATGQVYRIVESTPSNVVETSAVRGIKHRLSTNNKLTSDVLISGQITGDPATQSGASYSAEAAFSSGLNGYVVISFSGLGAEGLDTSTLTSSTIKIYDTDSTALSYVPVSSFKLTTDNGDSAKVVALFDASYKQRNHAYKVLIGGVKALGATTATTDDTVIGDYTNTTQVPYGYVVVSGSGPGTI
jgi:hypothetical protein